MRVTKNKARNLENVQPSPPKQQTGFYYLKEQKWSSFAITQPDNAD